MVTPAELAVILGPQLRGEAASVLGALEAGAEGKVNALTFLCGAVAMCRVAPGPGGADRADGVKDKARRLFALFDFSKARALNSSELGIMLLSLGRALESFMGLKRGSSIAAFIDMTALDHAARVAVKRYDSALRRGGASSDDASQPRLPRKDFVEWSLRILSPYCRPPVVLDALKKLVRAASTDAETLSAATRAGLEQMSILGAEAAQDASLYDVAYEPDRVPGEMEIDGDGRWVPFASAKDAGERAWLLEECAKMPCFGELTRRELGVVADAFRLKRFAPGQRVYAEGKGKKIVDGSKGRDHKTGELIVKETEKGDDFFVVLDGSVECTKYVAGANDSVCPTLKKGDFFGELALLKNKNRAATAIALNDVEVLAVPRSLFDALVKPLPALVKDYEALEALALESAGDAEKRAAARREKRKKRKGKGDNDSASAVPETDDLSLPPISPRTLAARAVPPADDVKLPPIGAALSHEEMANAQGVSATLTLTDYSIDGATSTMKGQFAADVGKHAGVAGDRAVHVQAARSGSLVLDLFIETPADDEHTVATSLSEPSFVQLLADTWGAVSVSNVELHRPGEASVAYATAGDATVGSCVQIFSSSMCAYATVSTQALRLCFENSTRAIDPSKN
ncbi:cAMP-dependent protein kinase regulator [Aureococcus anophagefferens]|nr:cAMP-dependent protein kinase regulator [Aureococcus anophagefferens]